MELAIELASERRSIMKVEEFLSSFDAVRSLDQTSYYNLMIAATEAVNNAIVHGNKLSADKKVHLMASATEMQLIVSVKDEGTGFNPASLPDPRDPENLLKEGGRGIFLIESLIPHVEYYSQDNGFEIRMFVPLSGPVNA